MAFSSLLILMTVCVSNAAVDIAPADLMKHMLAQDSEIQSGESKADGKFVLALVKISSTDANALSKARQQAMQRIGEYLGAFVSAEVKSESSESVAADGKAISGSFFSDSSSVQVQQTLAGIEAFQLAESGGDRKMSYMLSEGTSRRTAALSEAARGLKKSDGPIVVEAMGIATMSGPLEDAQQHATEAARTSAVEMALGVTLVGMTFSLSEEDDAGAREKFRSSAFTQSSGFIESYVVIGEGPSDGRSSYWVRIRATVTPNKIFDNYRAHLRAIGDPTFAIDAAGDETLADRAQQFFTEKGFRVVDPTMSADWKIELKATYTPRTHPTNGAEGVQCVLGFRLKNSRTGELFGGVKTDGRASDFRAGGAERQRARVAELAFKNASEEVHKAINDSIVQLAREGRTVMIRIGGFDRDNRGVDPSIPEQLQARLATLPGVRAPSVGVTNGWLTVELKSLIPSDALAPLVASDACALLAHSTPKLTKVELNEIEIYVDPLAK